jgi:superfamily II DNA/RNA helicase
MYHKSKSPGSRPGRAQFGARRNSFNGRPRVRSNFGGGSKIHPSKFICKASPTIESAPYIPVNKFADFMVDARIKFNIDKKGYVNPTPIQDEAIPFVLAGRDVVGIANTGTGKTAAFIVPLLDKILKNPREKILVIVPTRELAMQINQELM